MKNTLSYAIAAAALVVGSHAAVAGQVVEMTAPVAFKTNGAAMPQGRYTIELTRLNGGSPIAKIISRDGGPAAMSVTNQFEHRGAKPSDAVVRFACAPDADCHVASITVGTTKWAFPTPKMTPEQKRNLYTVTAPVEPARAAE